MRIWLLLLVMTMLVCVGCDDDGDDHDDDDDEVEILTAAEHDEGWQQADCRSCHADAHHEDDDIEDCVECHGTNGAPDQPAISVHTIGCGDALAGGAGCHPGQHGGTAAGFPEGQCLACHASE